MSTSDLAAAVLAKDPDTTKRLDELAAKVTEVITDVAAGTDLSFDDVLDALVQRQQLVQQLRGQARAAVERAILEENADRIAAETEKRIAEAQKG